MNPKMLLGIVIHFLLGLTVSGQIKIKGRLVDYASGIYLEHVRVHIDKKPESQFTDDQGYFEMSTFLKKEEVLICEIAAYETLRIPLQLSNDQHTIDLGLIRLLSLKKADSNDVWFDLSQEEVELGQNEIDNISGLLSAGKDAFSRAAPENQPDAEKLA